MGTTSSWYRRLSTVSTVVLLLSLGLPAQTAAVETRPASTVAQPAIVAPQTASAAPALSLYAQSLPPTDFVPTVFQHPLLPIDATAHPLMPFASTQNTQEDAENLASGKSADASSTEPGTALANLTDGDKNTDWSSAVDAGLPQWLQVDLGQTYTITKVIMHWREGTNALGYTIATSNDGATFTDVSVEQSESSGNQDEYVDKITATGRYVRITVIDAQFYDSNVLGYLYLTHIKLSEIEIYGAATVPDDQMNPPERCPCDGQDQTDNPVNTRTGVFWTTVTDLRLTSPGPELSWSRTYSSQDVTATTTLGPGWRHPYSTRLITETMLGGEPGHAIIVTPEGNRFRFEDLGNGAFRTYPGLYDTLVRANGVYTQTLRDQTRYIFDGATGRLQQILDPQGRALQVIYDPVTGLLEKLADATAPQRFLQLSYNITGTQILSVTDGIRTQNYQYNANGDLERATDVMNRATTYLYQQHRLTHIINPLGQIEEHMQYTLQDNNWRVFHQDLLDGRELYFDYTVDETRVQTFGMGGGYEDQRIAYGPDDTVNAIIVNGTTTESKNYDEQFAPGRVSDANGNSTLTTYNEQGQLTQRMNALGEATQYEYDLLHRPVVMTDTVGRRTEMAYDVSNNLTRQTTDIIGAFPGFTTVYTYNVRYPGKNWLEDMQGVDGVRTRYEYDTLGQLTATIQNYVDGVYDQAYSDEDLRTTYIYDAVGRPVAVTVGAGTPFQRTDTTVYNADDTTVRTIQNYVDGVMDASQPLEDIITEYGYDDLGRQVWVKDALGHYDTTHYNQRGRVDWTVRNLSPFQVDADGLPVFQPFVPSVPDANVATLYAVDGLGRTTLITQTGILLGAFDVNTQTFATATTRVTAAEYDTLNRPVAVIQNYQPGQTAAADVNVRTETQYDDAGNVLGQRDTLGRWTYTEYDVLSRPITVTLNYENGDPLTVTPENQVWATTTDTDIQQVTHYAVDGKVDYTIENYLDGVFAINDPVHDRKTVYLYDALGRVSQTIQNYVDGNPATGTVDTDLVTETAYDAAGRVRGTRDPLGRWTVQQYDDLSRVERTIQNCRTSGGAPTATGCASFVTTTPDRNVPMVMSYDALGRAGAVTDALGQTTQTAFDVLGRVMATTQNYQPGQPASSDVNVTTSQVFDILGRTTVMTDAVGATTGMTYDALGRPVTTTDPAERVTRVGYDGIGTQRWQETPDGRFTVMRTDGLGRVTATIVNYDDGQIGPDELVDQDLVTQTVYDVAGRKLQAIAPDGKVTAFAYDLANNLRQVTENVIASCSTTATDCNVVTTYLYDRAGNRTTIIDANAHERSFGYDALDRQVRSTDGLLQDTIWTYDRGGRKIGQDDPRDAANTLTFDYDEVDRLESTSATNLPSPITAQYDALGRRRWIEDATGRTNFTYDALGRATTVQAPTTGTVNYGYNARGERELLTYPDSASVSYTYLPDGQIDLVQQGSTTLADYDYDVVGRIASVERANGAITTYSYNQADYLQDLETTVGSTTVSDYQYTMNRAGLRTQEQDLALPNDASLVADLAADGGSDPSAGVMADGLYFFYADDGVHGYELWKSDGTMSGTAMVADIQDGADGSNIEELVVAQQTVFFTADDGVHGRELWKSDGTATGTSLVKDIASGAEGGAIGFLTVVGMRVFFQADNGTHGRELWMSDGTVAGTALVKDINLGSDGSYPSSFAVLNNVLFFDAYTSTNGDELWRSDGTAAGTTLVQDIYPGSGSGLPYELTVAGDVLYFSANDGVSGHELWRTNGTNAGTSKVLDIRSGTTGSYITAITAIGDTIFFVADDGTSGVELWHSDGTSTGTVLVKDVWAGSASAEPAMLTIVNDVLFFTAEDGVHGIELWRSDGTTVGTTLVSDVWPGSDSAYIDNLIAFNGTLLFQANDGIAGAELWKSDGTATGTVLVNDIYPGSDSSYPYNLISTNGAVFFQADDGVSGSELWHYREATQVDYQYDGLNRLIAAQDNTGPVGRYVYDRVGNRTTEWTNGDVTSQQAYNAANQVVGWEYDGAGNLIDDGTTTYTYDPLNRMTVRDATNYAYNGDGTLVAQTSGSTTTRYTQDLAAPISQVLNDGTANYVYGRERLVGVNGTGETWYIGDALSSVRQTLDDTGAQIAATSYDAWGTPEQTMIAPFGFTGELQDAGNIYLRARWYQSSFGSFTSVDPFGGFDTKPYSLHPYQYAYANSVLWTDPSGRCLMPDGTPCPQPAPGPVAPPVGTPTPPATPTPPGPPPMPIGDGSDCIAAYVRQVSSNTTWGVSEQFLPPQQNSVAMLVCSSVGDITSILQGLGEVSAGGTMAGVGGLACVGVVTCFAGGAAIVAGGATIVHGGGVAVQGTWKLTSRIYQLCMAAGAGGGGGGGGPTPTPPAPVPTPGPAVPRGVAEFDIVQYKEQASGFEKHHAVLDVWGRANIPGYNTREAPSIVMSLDRHQITRNWFNNWRRNRTGNITGFVDWSTMGAQEAQQMSYDMLKAASVPDSVASEYFRQFNKYIYSIR